MKDMNIDKLVDNIHFYTAKNTLVANIENTNKVLTKRDKRRLDMHLHNHKKFLLENYKCDILEVNFIS